ncbi:MAG: hypothetical protein ACLFP9_02180, partial [Desulfonatronovibrio sp.]
AGETCLFFKSTQMVKGFWLSPPKSLRQFAAVLSNQETCISNKFENTNFTDSGFLIVSCFL